MSQQRQAARRVLLRSLPLLTLSPPASAQDHAAYLGQNRDKLRRYVAQYVVTGGGK